MSPRQLTGVPGTDLSAQQILVNEGRSGVGAGGVEWVLRSETGLCLPEASCLVREVGGERPGNGVTITMHFTTQI